MSRWVVHSSATFNASHALTRYRGEPETPHDHRWRVAVRVGTDALNDEGKALRGSRILLLGVAYKANVGDLRESPALDLIELLRAKRAEVTYHDPYVPRLELDGLSLRSVELSPEVLAAADCAVITTVHGGQDWHWILQNTRLVVDTRNATAGVNPGPCRIVKL